MKITIKGYGKPSIVPAQTDLGEHAQELIASYEISPTRTAAGQKFSHVLTDKDLTEIYFEDGTSWLAKPADLVCFFKAPNRTLDQPIKIPPFVEVKGKKRDFLQKVSIKFIHVFKSKAADLSQPNAGRDKLLLIANQLENKVLDEGLHLLSPDFMKRKFDRTDLNDTIDLDQPVLVLIHGMGSSTEGSFGQLKTIPAWLEFCKRYKNNILTFEYKSWTKSPFENALDLLRVLPDGIRLHLLTHSQGGLIGDLLARCAMDEEAFADLELKFLESNQRIEAIDFLRALNAEATGREIKLEKYVRVAGPLAGTTLIAKELVRYLNVLMNLLKDGSTINDDPLVESVKSLIKAVVHLKSKPAHLPGLEALLPNSPLQSIFNNHGVSVDNELVVISGDAGGAGTGKALSHLMKCLFYREDGHDYLVDTASMSMGVMRETKVYFQRFKGPHVHHFAYFKNEESREAVFRAFTTLDISREKGFSLLSKRQVRRNIELNLPGKEVFPVQPSNQRPIVVLIPGIMGSNLYERDQEVWIHYGEIIRGGLTKLKYNNKNVTAKAVVKSAYGKLTTYLSFNSGYDVLVFPYDWRSPLEEAGNELNRQLKPLLKGGQRIQIIAHSMGGLVARELMMRHQSTWSALNKRADFRCLLLGTPWTGAYQIPLTLLGLGSRIKSISRLALYQSGRDLLEIFIRFKGLLELLPVQGYAFDKPQLWEILWEVTEDETWVVPKNKDLKHFKEYKAAIKKAKLNLDNVYYVAGKDKQTVDDFVLRDQFGSVFDFSNLRKLKKTLFADPEQYFQLVFKATDAGDGSVTWDSGIPAELLEENRVYYMPTKHGELANDEEHFRSILELLESGHTNRLPQNPSVSRAGARRFDLPELAVLKNEPTDIVREILGLNTDKREAEQAEEERQQIQLRVMNGHLQYARNPLVIGHFEGDGIVSGERVMDYLLDGKLTIKRSLGAYPGRIGTKMIVFPDENEQHQGAVIVGLGNPENLSPFLLTKTVEAGCLEYLYSIRNIKMSDVKEVGLSSLLIGTGYGNLSMNSSVSAIVNGVQNANRKVKDLGYDLPYINEIEFIELYEHKANDAFYTLDQLEKGDRDGSLKLFRPIKKAEGGRTHISFTSQQEWWKRIRAVIRKEDNGQRDHFYFSASTGRAKVDVREQLTNVNVIESLLEDNYDTDLWDRRLMRTIFELLIPNDFKMAFKDQQNILLVLDNATANYPWELLHYDEQAKLPICVSAGMIRQLSTAESKGAINLVKTNKVLIIGDPVVTTKNVPQLLAARRESHELTRLLRRNGFEVYPEIFKPFKDIYKALYDDFKIIHIASHGVIDFNGKSGLLLSDDNVLTAADISKLTNVPELVFVNSCYLGHVDAEAEEHFRQKYRLAANIGTEFIDKGVKAVVVAGWAVNDDAADLFASIFYDFMLGGATFGQAVKAARRACYKAFPTTTTWGAYQCYGDPFYKMVKTSFRNEEERSYIVVKEVLADLEILLNDAKSGRTRNDRSTLEKNLEKTIRCIDKSGLRNGEITELEAKIYEDLELNDLALKKYEALFEFEKSAHYFKSLQLWLNLRGRNLLVLQKQEPSTPFRAEISEIIHLLEDLLKLGETSERYSLLGSIYKRKAMLCTDKTEKREAILEMSNHYRKAFELNNPGLIENKIYPLTNWLIAELLVNHNSRGMRAIKVVLKEDIASFLMQKLESVKQKSNDRKEFWDLLEEMNIYQCLLLLDKGDEALMQRKNQIVNSYQKAWRKGGTLRQKSSEVEQMAFFENALKCFRPRHKELIRTAVELRDFFKQENPAK